MEESARDKLKKFLEQHGYKTEAQFEAYLLNKYRESPPFESKDYIFKEQIDGFFYEILMENLWGIFNYANLLNHAHLSQKRIDDILMRLSFLIPTLQDPLSFFVIDPDTGEFRFTGESAGLLLSKLIVRRNEIIRIEHPDSEIYKQYKSSDRLLRTLRMLITNQLHDSEKKKYEQEQ